MSLSKLRENIFELQALEIRRLLTTATVDASHILQILGTTGNDNITVNKNSAGKLTVSGVTATFTIGSAAGQANAINIQASSGDDIVLLTSNVKNGTAGIPSTIAGNDGNDSLTGGPGNDVLSGGNGNDTLDGGVGNDVMTGGANTDTSNYSNRTNPLKITMGSGADDGEVGIHEADDVETEEVIGGAGNDTITGSSLQDFIAGGGGADIINGGDGNDELTSSSGSSQLFGQNGSDALYAQNGNKDTVNGGTNSDGTADFDTALVDGVDVGSVNSLLAADTANPSGSDLDPTYGNGGKTLATALGWDSINGSAIDSQGRAYFVGTVADPNDTFGGTFNDDLAVARFDANGNLDTTYSGGNVANVPAGQARVDFTSIDGAGYGFTDDFASGIIIAPGDKVILLGSTNPSDGSPTAMAVARLNSDGSMDTTFGTLSVSNSGSGHTGLQKISIVGSGYGGGYGGDDAIDAVVQADGKIDIAGTHQQDFAVARLLTDGTLDTSAADPTGNFNGVGYNTLDVNDGSNDAAYAIALQTLAADGGTQRIIVGGNSDSEFAIARFNANGTLDTSFGNAGGIVESDFGGSNGLSDLAVNSQNQIVAVGYVSAQIAEVSTGLAAVESGQQDAILAVYPATGQGAPSVVDQAPTSGDSIQFNYVTIDSQNRIVVAGEQDSDIVVARYLSNLSVDTSFANPFTTVDFTGPGEDVSNYDFPLAVSVLSNKTIVVSGDTFPGGDGAPEAVAMRFKGDVSNVPPGTNEGDVEGITTFLDYNSLHANPPSPQIAALLAALSPAAKLYVLSKPDNQGVARFQLSDAANNVTIGTEIVGDGKLNVIVTVDNFTMYFDASKLTRIEIYGNGGNDSIIAANNLPVPLVIDGGAGNDIINGGAKNDVLLGGPGIDLIDGQAGADVIVGGPGTDALYGDDGNDIVIGGGGLDLMAGGAGDDIQIAGTTSYDTNVTALQNLIAEWGSTNTNALRVAHIRGTTPGGLNNTYFLKVGVGATVFDDGIADVLTNDAGRDWFFFHNTGSILVRDQVLFGTGTDEVTFI